ncbi:ArsA-related P-loop ATPase, partial [Salmonella enterica]
QYRAAVDALANAELTRMVLVARAQTATLKEVSRTYDELAAIGLTQQYLVINGLLPDQEAAHDKLAQALYQREQQAL